MNRLVFMILLCPTLLWARYVPSDLSYITCRKEIEKDLKKYIDNPDWHRSVDPQVNVKSFKSPTDTFGRWIEIQSFPDPYLFVFDSEQTYIYQYSSKKCDYITSSSTKPLDFFKKKFKKSFTDLKLKKIVNTDKFSLIYIWSPQMTYSMSEMNVFKKVAEELGLNFIPVLDYTQDPDEAKKSLSYYNMDIEIVSLQSLELTMRATLVHFPVSFVVGAGKISSKIYGVYTNDLLSDLIQKEISNMKLRGSK